MMNKLSRAFHSIRSFFQGGVRLGKPHLQRARKRIHQPQAARVGALEN